MAQEIGIGKRAKFCGRHYIGVGISKGEIKNRYENSLGVGSPLNADVDT